MTLITQTSSRARTSYLSIMGQALCGRGDPYLYTRLPHRLKFTSPWLQGLLAMTIIFQMFVFNFCYASQDTYAFTNKIDSRRFSTLIQEIRCVVCQNQTIADSNAPLANDLREKIYRMVLANKSNDEIKGFLVNRYGEFILLKPHFNKLTMLLWLFPFFGLVFILMFFLSFALKNHKNTISLNPNIH